MATDKNGRELKVGDEVWVKARIEVLSHDERYALIVVVDGADDYRTLFPSSKMLLQPSPPDDFMPTPGAAAADNLLDELHRQESALADAQSKRGI